ncbi:MAG: hypothetical protein ACJ76S_13460 [Solirubrobacteraceae bacterium]
MREKLDIGGVISRVFNTYRDQAGVLLPAAVLVYLPFAIINGIILSTGANVILVFITSILQAIAALLFTGMVVQLVRDIQDGRRDSSIGQLFESVVPVLGALIGVIILAAIGITIGFILLIVPGLILLTLWAVVVPVTVVERPGVTAAFGRSRELVRGSGWQVLAVLVIFFLIQVVLGRVLGAIVAGITASVVGVIIAQLLVNVLVGPLTALAQPTMYFDLRRLKEAAPAAAGAVEPAPAGAAPTGGTGAPAPGAGTPGPGPAGPGPGGPTQPGQPPPPSQPPPPAAG